MIDALAGALAQLGALPVSTLAVAAFAVTLAYTVFGMTGFGAAVVAVPLLAHVLPVRFAVPMMLVFDLVATLLLGLRNRRLIERGELLRLVPWAVVGMVIGAGMLVVAPERLLLALLGVFVMTAAAWNLLGRGAREPIATAWSAPAGVAGGVFSALYGTGGPIYTIYLAGRLFDPARLRATIATLIFFAAWARLALFSATGLMFQPSLLTLALALVPFAVLGYAIGSALHRCLQPRHATRVIWLLLAASGASLLVRAAGAA